MFLQAKSQSRAAAPSAGPVVDSQPTHPTSSHTPTTTNTVRIEKLSDEEDQEVDITDDLSDDGDDDHKPQVVLKTASVEPEYLNGAGIQTETLKAEEEEADVGVKMDQLSHISSQSPQASSYLPHSEKTGLTKVEEKHNGRVSPQRPHLQSAAQGASAPTNEESEAQNSQPENSQQTGQLEEEGSDGTGKIDAFT